MRDIKHYGLVDKLLVSQKFEATQIKLGIRIVNKYEVKNSTGQKTYSAVAKSNKCCRIFCGKQRPFKVCVRDNTGTDAMYFKRHFRCSCFCSPCCLEKLEVQAATGEPIGYVIQKWHACLPKFIIQNKNRDTVLRIRGPFSRHGCCNSSNFKIKTLKSNEEIGRIAKIWGGHATGDFTEADKFEISFPMNLDVNIKAVLLGACILIVSIEVFIQQASVITQQGRV